MSFTHVPVFVDQPQGPFPLIPKVHKLNDLHVRSYAQAGAGLVLADRRNASAWFLEAQGYKNRACEGSLKQSLFLK